MRNNSRSLYKEVCTKEGIPLKSLVSQLFNGKVHLRGANKQLGHAQLHFVFEVQARWQRHALDGPQNLLATILKRINEGELNIWRDYQHNQQNESDF